MEVMEELCPGCPEWKIRRELSLLVWKRTLCGGHLKRFPEEKTKLQLAALFCRRASFPLIDELTNHLDIESRKIVSEHLRRQKGFLLVSHDRAFLDGCVDHILSIGGK